MKDRDTVELALYALEEGMSVREAAELAGVSGTAVRRWAAGAVPHARRAPAPRGARAVVTDEAAARALEMARRGLPKVEIAAELGLSRTTVYNILSGKRGARRREVAMERPTEVDPSASEEVQELQRRLRAAELDRAYLEEMVEILKGGGPQCGPSRRELASAAAALAARGFSLAEALGRAGIARSTYYYLLSHPEPARRHEEISTQVREAFEELRGQRGYRAVLAVLRRRGVAASERAVRRSMREQGLRAAYCGRRRRAYSSYQGEAPGAPGNLLARDFSAAAPNEKWLTDITEFRLPGGEKAYLSVVVDCFDGRLASWSVGPSPNAELANSSLRAACAALGPGEAPVVHSDRGCHYRWPGWVAICEENGLARSMSRKGCSPDNAACEGFFGRLKNEFFHYADWGGVGLDEFMSRLCEYLEYYNEGRIKESLGWMSPNEFRRSRGYAV